VGKITILRKKIIFFPILGGRAPGADNVYLMHIQVFLGHTTSDLLI
jgi:hypothetical protein